LLAGWLWFLLGLAPVVRGVRLGLAQYADRWTYLPLIGAGIALAWLAAEVVRGRARKALPAVAGLVLAACAAKTHAQLPWWRDTLTMFARAAWLTPVHPLVQSTYGQALYQAGRFGEGEAHLRAALELDPDKAEYLSNWGRALLRLGRAEEALAAQDRAIARQPEVGRFHGNRGNALLAWCRDEAKPARGDCGAVGSSELAEKRRVGWAICCSGRTRATKRCRTTKPPRVSARTWRSIGSISVSPRRNWDGRPKPWPTWNAPCGSIRTCPARRRPQRGCACWRFEGHGAPQGVGAG
jgi:tetratricopeptide (TPR) repeat protein